MARFGFSELKKVSKCCFCQAELAAGQQAAYDNSMRRWCCLPCAESRVALGDDGAELLAEVRQIKDLLQQLLQEVKGADRAIDLLS